ncbi:MAG: hypothetical protein M3Z41_08750 [Candidatus Eremiobacteraeota bacterium]|nr:hypothetical protein [Candidatus Eremiobacteraeota bacterium]
MKNICAIARERKALYGKGIGSATMSGGTIMTAVILGLLLWSCSQTKLVPVCSEHGGVKSMTPSDGDYYTRDAVCKDGTTQRPEQVEDANGKYRLVVPSEHQ